MEFGSLLEHSAQTIATLLTSDVSLLDKESLCKDLDALFGELNRISLGGDSSFLLDKEHYLKKPEPQDDEPPMQDYVMAREGNSFDRFYELVDAYYSGDRAKAKKIYDEIYELGFYMGDVDAKVAISMCKYLGIFHKRSKATYQEELIDYVRYNSNGTAAALMAQFIFFEVYRKNHDYGDKDRARQYAELGVSYGSNMAKAFMDRYFKRKG